MTLHKVQQLLYDIIYEGAQSSPSGRIDLDYLPLSVDLSKRLSMRVSETDVSMHISSLVERGFINAVTVKGAAMSIEPLRGSPQSNAVLPSSIEVSLSKEGIFIAGQMYDALALVGSVITDATRDITLIDGYVDQNVLSLLSGKNSDVIVRLITSSRCKRAFVSALATAFNSQYGGLDVRMADDFHDRFIIIDDDAFYHLGASIKDAGKRGFMFSKLEEVVVIDVLREELARVWASATPLI